MTPKRCLSCGEEQPVEPYSGLCLECLVAAVKRVKQLQQQRQPVPFDAKAVAARNDE